MAVTQDSLRKRIRALIYTAQPQARPYQDLLTTSPSAVATTVGVTDGTQWSEGDVIDFDDGDQAVVTGIATNTLTIRREADATAHTSGDAVWRNPRFSTRAIDYGIETILEDLYPDVWQIVTDSFTYAAATEWYPIADTDLMEVLTVFYEDDDDLTPVPIPVWRQYRGIPGADFTQAQGVKVPGNFGMDEGDTVYVVYRAKIGAVTDLLDRQEVLVATGAAYSLLNVANTARTHDPSRWTDRTVQPGQEARDAVPFLRDFFTLRRREELRLLAEEKRLPRNYHAEKARRFIY